MHIDFHGNIHDKCKPSGAHRHIRTNSYAEAWKLIYK